MAYTDIGFNEFLVREDPSSQVSQELDPLAFDSFTSQVSGSKVQGGIVSSPDGKIKLDLDGGSFVVNDGVQELVRLGILADGSVGFLVNNSDGTPLMQISATKFFLQSKSMKFDFITDQFTVSDEFGIPVVLLGKLSS